MPASWSPPEDAVTVSAAELRRNFGVWQERAFSAPVVVARHGKPRLVLSSAARYFVDSQPDAPPPVDQISGAILAIPEHSTEGLLVLDHGLRILAVNHVFEDMVGRSASRMLGQPWADLFPGAMESVVGAQFRHVLRTGASVQFETPSLATEGRFYRATVFPHEHGVAVLIVNRTAEIALQHEIAEYRSLVASYALIPRSAYVRISLRAFIESASPQFAGLFGFEAASTPHAQFTEIVAPDLRADVLEKLDRVLSGEQLVRLSTRLMNRDGETLAASMSLAPIWRGASVEGAMAFLRLLDE